MTSIFGVGVDQVNLNRVRKLLEKNQSKFEKRCFTKNEIMKLQEKLSAKYDVGGIDGLIGHKTRRAIGIYQKDKNLRQTCWLPL